MEPEMYDHTSNNWSHRDSNEKLKEKFGSCTRKTLDRFTTKDSYTWNITHNAESIAVWSLKPERWGSPLVQEKYQEEKVYSIRTTYPFPILHSLSPHSAVTNLHILLLFSYFLLVARWWLS